MSPGPGVIEPERRGALAVLSLVALDGSAALEALLSCLRKLSVDENVRAVLLDGSVGPFLGGADLDPPGTGTDTQDEALPIADVLASVVRVIRQSPKPFVAAVGGPCVGDGVAIALACDLVAADRRAFFQLPNVHSGRRLDAGICFFLTQRIRIARASELCLLGEPLLAQTALEWGIINRVCEPAALQACAVELSMTLANGPSLALASIKQALSVAAYPQLTASAADEVVKPPLASGSAVLPVD